VGMEFVQGQTLREWMAAVERPRHLSEVLRVFIAAGRGLAAAHEVGLVHRDFKPDNVMLGTDGRVRVMDFGLARSSADNGAHASSESTVAARRQHEATHARDDTLTQTGAVMGTPAYMPIEQFEAKEADARSDQFSFCVALYEALYGERPFAGNSMGELVYALQSEQIRETPKGTKVPVRLRKIIVRGLAAQRDARWPSMAALLDALADDPAQRRRKWWAGTILVGVVVGAAWGVWYAGNHDAQPCMGMDARLDGVWDDEQHTRVRAAIEGTQLSYAPDTWERVEQRLDDYTQRWVAARVEACEATDHGEQSGELLDLRMACLDERLSHVRAMVELFAAADETVVKKAVEVVASLPRLERCADVEALLAELPPPEDPDVARRVATLDEQLIAAEVLEKAGKFEDGLALATAVVLEAEKLGYAPLLARAWLRQGILQSGAGEFGQAQATLERAYETAVELRMAAAAADASRYLVYVVGSKLAQHEAGRQWAKHAKPLARAVGTDEAHASYLNNLGNLAFAEGKYEEARDHFGRALAIREQALGSDHPDVTVALFNIGNAAFAEGKYEEARSAYERALAASQNVLGPDHPTVAHIFNSLGNVATFEGKYTEAHDHHERALAIKQAALGPDHPEVAVSLNNLGNVAKEEGKYEEARRYYERSLAIKEKVLGPSHPDVAVTLNNLGAAADDEGKHEDARRYHERALAIREQALGPDHPLVAFSLTGLGRALLAQDKPADALIHLERALSIRTSNNVDPTRLASTRFALARALWNAPADAGQDRGRARELGELARDAFAAAGEKSAGDLAQIQAWLADLQ
jgi:tetratricopeptide (TPR) repeat protein